MTILQEFYEKHYKRPSGCDFQALTNAQLRALKMSKEFREFMLENMFEKQAKAIEENRIAVETLCKAVNAMQMSFIGFQERFSKTLQNSMPKVGIDLKSVEIPDIRIEVPQFTIVDGLINKLNEPLDAGTRNPEEEYDFTVTFRPTESKELMDKLDSIADNQFNPESEKFDMEPIRKAYLKEQRLPDEDVLAQFNKQVDSWGLTEDQEKLRLILGNELSKAPLSEEDFQKYKELQVLFGEFTYGPSTGLDFEPLSHQELYTLIDKWANSPVSENEDIGFDRIFKSSELIKLHRYKHYTKRI